VFLEAGSGIDSSLREVRIQPVWWPACKWQGYFHSQPSPSAAWSI
jgi:hypothetical protein